MTPLRAHLPVRTVLADAGGRDRVLRVTWHDDVDQVVVSTWRGGSCVATCRLSREDVGTLVGTLATGLARTPRAAWSAPTYDRFRSRWQRMFRRGRTLPPLRAVAPVG